MRKEPPEKVSQSQIVFDVSEIEPLLSGPALDVPPWEPVTVKLNSSETMLIRSLKKEEAPLLLSYLKKVMEVEHDFYDIVGARVYAEVLGWYRNRLKDPYTFVGLIDGKLVGFANGRLMNEEINISLHSMAFKRGGKIGAIMYYTKAYYAFEILDNEEFWATYESYNGWKRWGLGMAQPSYPWPEYQHELGGAKVYYITKVYWESVVKKYLEDYIGISSKFEKDIPKDVLEKNSKLILLDSIEV